jgi:hypothetical protein
MDLSIPKIFNTHSIISSFRGQEFMQSGSSKMHGLGISLDPRKIQGTEYLILSEGNSLKARKLSSK